MSHLDEMKALFTKMGLEFKTDSTEDCENTLFVYDHFGKKSSFFFNADGSFMNVYYYENAACYDASVENDLLEEMADEVSESDDDIEEFNLMLRESDEIREMKSIEGNTYYLRKSAYGFGEEYIFYDKNEIEIERFTPSASYENIDGFYELDDSVLFQGLKIRAEFSFSEFYK